MNTILLREHLLGIRLAIQDPQNVHGAVADVCHHHRAGELPELVESLVVVHQRHQCGIALGEYDAVGQMDAVQQIVEGKPDVGPVSIGYCTGTTFEP